MNRPLPEVHKTREPEAFYDPPVTVVFHLSTEYSTRVTMSWDEALILASRLAGHVADGKDRMNRGDS